MNHRSFLRALAIAAGIAAGATVGVAAPAPATAAPGRTIDESTAAAAKGTVQINNVSGSVVVEGWSKNRVEVTGTLGKGAKDFELKSSGKRTKVRVVGPEHSGRMEGSYLRIKAPAGSSLDIVTVSADVEIRGLNGDFEVKTVSGKIIAAGKPATIDLNTVSGKVDTVAGSRSTRTKSVSGDTTVRGKGKNLVMKTVSGKLHASSPLFQRCELGSVSGSIELEGGLGGPGPIRLKSHSGNVKLNLAKAVKGAFDLSTFSGAIRSGLGGTVEKGRGPGKTMRFEQGSGGPDVVIRTFSGDIELVAR